MITLQLQPELESALIAEAQTNGEEVATLAEKVLRSHVEARIGLPSTEAEQARIAAYQLLLDLAAAADASEGIRQGLEELRQGKGRPMNNFRNEMHDRYALPR